MDLGETFFADVIFTFINITVLYFILKKLLFGRIGKHMEERTKKIEDALELADQAKKKVEEMKEEYDAKLRLAKEEGNQIIADYKLRADKEYEEALETAKHESELIVQKAKQELEVEKEQLVSELKKQMSDLVLAASQKVLKQNLDNEANRKLISEFIDSK